MLHPWQQEFDEGEGEFEYTCVTPEVEHRIAKAQAIIRGWLVRHHNKTTLLDVERCEILMQLRCAKRMMVGDLCSLASSIDVLLVTTRYKWKPAVNI